MLVARVAERQALDGLLAGARAGHGGALVVRGEPGIGKSALLDYALQAAADMYVTRIAGLESEALLDFAALQQLTAPLFEAGGRLSEPQRRALELAVGLEQNGPPDRFHLGLAVRTLFGNRAVVQPVLFMVDDLQWIDRPSAETLAFVARRLDGGRIAALFAVREPTETWLDLAGLSELPLTGLADESAVALLLSAVTTPLEDRVRDRLVVEARGNPSALIELSGALTPAQLAGTSAIPEPVPLNGSVGQSFVRRARRLPAETQLLLILLAAQHETDADALPDAARRLGIGPEDAEPARSEGLLAEGRQPTFAHPLIRSAIYGAAGADELRRVHQALGEATDPHLAPDANAWYRASAAAEPDEDLAAALMLSAARIQARSGYAAAAPLLLRASQITPDARQRSERTLAAAAAHLAAGSTARAAELLAEATPGLTDPLASSDARRLRDRVDYELGRPIDEPDVLLAEARTLEPLDLRRARDVYLDALNAAVLAGRFGTDRGVVSAAEAARTAPPVPRGAETAGDLLLDGFAALFTEGHAAAAPTLRRAVEEARHAADPLLLLLGAQAATELWDDGAVHTLANRLVDTARDSGALALLPRALNYRAAAYEVVVGRLDAAEACLRESREIRTTSAPAIAERGKAARALVAAWRGQEAETRTLTQEAMRDATARGQGLEVSAAQQALAVLEIGLGRYDGALAAAQDATADPSLHVTTATLPDLVEAAARSGERDVAAAAAERLSDSALASGSPWALGVLARSRALLAEDDEAEALYLEAIAHLQRCRAVPQLARAHLLYGEWLRRERRRLDARRPLRTAYDVFGSMGAAAFEERARIELSATGERGRPRTVESIERLTPQELRVARLVAEGASNPQVAAELQISRRTVEYHLRKIYRKLGVGSRTQLGGALSGIGAEPPAAH